MASLENVLGAVPGYGGYLARRGMIEDGNMDAIRQASGLVSLEGALQQRAQQQRTLEREQAFRTELAAAGDDMNAQARVASRYAAPADVLRTNQAALDRRAQVEARTAERAMALEAAASNAQLAREERERARQEAASLKRELAAMQDETRRMIAGQRLSVTVPPAVTVTDIQKPDGSVVRIDARTGRELGASPKESDAQKRENKRAFQMEGLTGALQQAEDLLMGVTRNSDGEAIPTTKPTNSGFGAMVDRAAGMVGIAPESAQRAQQLEVIGGVLKSKVPRFEGPQSDKDVAEYSRMAGQIGDRTVPIPARLAALRSMREIYSRYETGKSGRIAGQPASGATGNFGFPPQSAIDAEIRRRGGQ